VFDRLDRAEELITRAGFHVPSPHELKVLVETVEALAALAHGGKEALEIDLDVAQQIEHLLAVRGKSCAAAAATAHQPFDHWRVGEVVERLDGLPRALVGHARRFRGGGNGTEFRHFFEQRDTIHLPAAAEHGGTNWVCN